MTEKGAKYMIETVAAIDLAVDEKLIIKKNSLMPEVTN